MKPFRIAGALATSLLSFASARADVPSPSWSTLTLGDRAALSAVVPSPTQPGRLWAAGNGGGMWRSTDHGDTWSLAQQGLPRDVTFGPLAASPLDTGVVFAASTRGLFRSTTGGDQWSATTGRPGGDRIEALVFHPSSTQVLWAGSSGGARRGIYRSTDAGQTWNELEAGLPTTSVYAVAVHPTDGTQVLAGTEDGIARSTDGGDSWSMVLPGLAVGGLEWNAAQANVVWARPIAGALQRSTDFGQTWAPGSTDGGSHLAVDSTDPSKLFLGQSLQGCRTSGYCYVATIRRSTDAGASWQIAVESPSCGAHVAALDVDPDEPSRVYAAFSEGFLRSETGGVEGSWTEQVSGIHMFPTTFVRVGAGDKCYVRADAARGTFVSANGGEDWTLHPPLETGEAPAVRSFDANPVVPDLLHESGGYYSVGEWDAIWISYVDRSTTGATTWEPTCCAEWISFSLVISADDGRTVYAWDGADLWRSDDGLQTQTFLGSTIAAIDAVAVAPHLVVAVVDGPDPVRLSTDAGATWTSRSAGLPAHDEAVRILRDPGVPTHLLVALRRHGVYESTGFGSSWHAVGVPLARGPRPPLRNLPESRSEGQLLQIQDAAWDAAGGERRVFVATSGGVWAEGYGWLDDGLGSFRTTSISYSRAHQKLFVGTATHGAFAIDIPAVGGARAVESATGTAVLPAVVELLLAPNPFAGSTTIRFAVPHPGGTARLDVVDAAGRCVRRIVQGELPPGVQALTWDGRDGQGARAAAGVYFFRLDVGGKVTTKQAVRLR